MERSESEVLKIMVGVPVRNEVESLAKVLLGIPKIVGSEIWVLVVDDGSLDGSGEEARRVAGIRGVNWRDEVKEKEFLRFLGKKDIEVEVWVNGGRGKKDWGRVGKELRKGDGFKREVEVVEKFTGERGEWLGFVLIKVNRSVGLAEVFNLMIEGARWGDVDYLVQIDGDGQYVSREILKLVEVARADENEKLMVVGDRGIGFGSEMVFAKKLGNMVGNFLFKGVLGMSEGLDVSSGFRVLKRSVIELFWREKIMSRHTYTHESLILARGGGVLIRFVPIRFLPRKNGESRLISGVFGHVVKSLVGIGIGVFRVFSGRFKK